MARKRYVRRHKETGEYQGAGESYCDTKKDISEARVYYVRGFYEDFEDVEVVMIPKDEYEMLKTSQNQLYSSVLAMNSCMKVKDNPEYSISDQFSKECWEAALVISDMLIANKGLLTSEFALNYLKERDNANQS